MGIGRRFRRIYLEVGHLLGRATGRHYWEDFRRVYPDGIVFDCLGRRLQADRNHTNNFLNHCKFYRFAAQFVEGRDVADIGCGSGYGCRILHDAGAGRVCGADVSRHAIRFARARFGEDAEFAIQEITDLRLYASRTFDVAVCSEVLEHIKEYNLEKKALAELRRITRKGGLLVVGTPNSEMLDQHGFSFEEIDHLFGQQFSHYAVFENALAPFGEKYRLWGERLRGGRTGIVVSQNINQAETVLPKNVSAELKQGAEPGEHRLRNYTIDTALLHNTHSWIIVAANAG